MRNFVCLALVAALATGASAQWSDNFDGYANATQLHGVGGWKGWDNVPGAGALVTNAQSSSAPHSVAITGASDLVHTYSGANSGLWAYTGQVFIPSNFTGTTYFILLNIYNDAGPYDWSVQVHFDALTNTAFDDLGTSATLPFTRNSWTDFRVDIDLTADSKVVWLGGSQLSTGTWTQGTAGALDVGAVDLYANNASPVYYDNLALTPVPEPMTLAVLGMGALGVLRRRRK